jgi:hypothetical protein
VNLELSGKRALERRGEPSGAIRGLRPTGNRRRIGETWSLPLTFLSRRFVGHLSFASGPSHETVALPKR